MTEIRKSMLGLQENTRYAVRVRAVNPFGLVSAWSDSIVISTNPNENIPGTPAGLTVTAGVHTIVLTWTASGPNVDHYEIYAADFATFIPGPTTKLGDYAANSTIVTIASAFSSSQDAIVALAAGQTYYIVLRAIGPPPTNTPSDFSGVVSATTATVGTSDFTFGTISGSVISVNTLSADAISAGNLTATVGLVGTIKTGTSGARIALGKENDGDPLSDTGIFAWAPDETPLLAYRQSTGTLTIAGDIAGGTIDIGGADTSSFHVDALGNLWLGAADFASAPFRVSGAGDMVMNGSVTMAGLLTMSNSGVNVNATSVNGYTVVAGNVTLNIKTNTVTFSDSAASVSIVSSNGNIHLGGTDGAYHTNQLRISRTGQGPSWDTMGTVIEDTAVGAGLVGSSYHLPDFAIAGTIGFTALGPSFLFRNFDGSGYYPVAASAFNVSSSATTKQHVADLEHGIDALRQLRPVQFKRKAPKGTRARARRPAAAKKNHDSYRFGFIAEEVAEVLPEIVHWSGEDARPESLDYQALVPVLVKCIVELHDKLEGYINDGTDAG